MASAVAKIRFVRCPKCLNLLPEFAYVPMYKCGGCGTVLRAKNCHISKESAILGSKENDPSQSISDNDSSNNGSTTLKKNCLSSLKHGEEHNTFQNFSSTSPNAESYCHEKGESSCIDEKRESPDAVSSGPEETVSYSTNLLGSSNKDEDGSIPANSEYSFYVEEEKSLNLNKQGSDILRSNSNLEAPPELLGHSVASEEKMLDREHESRPSSGLNSPAASDDGLRDHVHNKYQLMSRRTIRRQWGSGSSKENERGEDLSAKEMNTNKKNSMSSLGSQSFYSVQSSMEPEKDGRSQSLSKVSAYFLRDSSECQMGSTSTKLKNLNHNRLELLKLVEELKDQLGRSCKLNEEKKQRSQFSDPLLFNREQRKHHWPRQYQSSQMPLSYQQCHLQPDSCCKNRLCRTCSYNFCCNSSKARGPTEHVSSGLSCYHHKARPSKRFCRPVSGGAPFVICYKCFEILHMPADLLISTRRLNKLRCGACSEILALPFPARDNEIPQATAENGNSSEGPISFSEEYGISFAESCLTETEPARISSDKSQDEKASGSPLHRLMGYPSARQLLC